MLQHRHINHISHLSMDEGMILQRHEDIEKELITYYRKLLSEPPKDCTQAIDIITQHSMESVTREQNDALL
jgi:hypothetical protein